ncbi:hypothetical protein P7C73_g2107, partial [Tremellales sp. Uapishka_1]
MPAIVHFLAFLPLIFARLPPSHSSPHSRDLLNLGASTCIRLRDSFTLDTSTKKGKSNTELTLKAGACVCIDVAASANILDVSSGVTITTDAGLEVQGQQALDIARAIEAPRSYPGDAALYNFAVAETCLAFQVGILTAAHSKHDFQPGFHGCCAMACVDGYHVLNGQCVPNPTCSTPYTYDTASNSCVPPKCQKGYRFDTATACCTPVVPSCSATQILCANQCYDAKTYTCPSGLPALARSLSRRSEGWCTTGLTKCAVRGWGEGSWECVDTMSDIESCGGCRTPFLTSSSSYIGEDCTSIPNVDEVGCHRGSCLIKSCRRGFRLSQNGTTCEERSRSGTKHLQAIHRLSVQS